MNATVRSFNKIVKKVRAEIPRFERMSDEKLKKCTQIFKNQIRHGVSLDTILPQAYACVCVADKRVLGMSPFDVQILGAVGMHKGYLCEMATGEGKTLTATMPLYLNALTGKSCILLTTNDYLAQRDAEEMGRVYKFLGLSVACGVTKNPHERFSNKQKKQIYASDIVYTTHGALGFDYLFNNLVEDANDRFLRDFYYVIMDEADSVLLDSAQMPLVIAGSYRVQSNLYEMADFFVTTLRENIDYEIEEKKVWLTEEGIKNAENFFDIENFYDSRYFEINRHVNLSLRAHKLFMNEKDYMFDGKGELTLLDGATGRLMPGVKLRGGLHQAIEVKEGLEPSRETKSVASITYQNLFNLFPKIAGISGTIIDAASELKSVYGVEVIKIPTNRPVIRVDEPDLYFRTKKEEYEAVIWHILAEHNKGRPVLAVASSINETEYISGILIEKHVPHNVLNASNAYWEADIIKEAGQMGAVTIATSMAGRGTDIKLGKGVDKLGGLCVVGVGRMPNVRLERQARGRAGRQGDPGSSRFFVSLEDETVELSPMSGVEKYLGTDKKISNKKLGKMINGSRNIGEERAVISRKSALEYDVVLQKQRKLVYATRNELLDGGSLSNRRLVEIAEGNISLFLKTEYDKTIQSMNRYILDNLSYVLPTGFDRKKIRKESAVGKYLVAIAKRRLLNVRQGFAKESDFSKFIRICTLKAIDSAWVDEVDYLQQLQHAVSGRSSAQKKPLYEYEKESFESFVRMREQIQRDIIRYIMLSSVDVLENGELHIVYP